MITYDPARKMMVAMPPYGTLRPELAKTAKPADVTATKAAQTADVKDTAKEEDFFDHLLDVVNPLQHLPIIGSIYRAATGDKLDAVEKIAGDALYGGLWGAVTAVADVAFEAVTGKSVEDTVMAWFDDGDDSNTALASIGNTVTGWFDGKSDAVPARVAAASIVPKHSLPSGALPNLANAEVASTAPDTLDIVALNGAMSAKGLDNDTAARALYAYRRSVGLTTPATPVTASLN